MTLRRFWSNRPDLNPSDANPTKPLQSASKTEAQGTQSHPIATALRSALRRFVHPTRHTLVSRDELTRLTGRR